MFPLIIIFYCFKAVFFFNDTATTEIYTLSLHDALPICALASDEKTRNRRREVVALPRGLTTTSRRRDRKSTRLNSSHWLISYAVFCLKKKKKPRSVQKSEQQKKIKINEAHNN